MRSASSATSRCALALLGITALLALTAVLIYPAYGSDIFDYVGFERMWVVHGDNPLLALPNSHPQDWSTPLVLYPDRTSASVAYRTAGSLVWLLPAALVLLATGKSRASASLPQPD
jgi:hypothetical protein